MQTTLRISATKGGHQATRRQLFGRNHERQVDFLMTMVFLGIGCASIGSDVRIDHKVTASLPFQQSQETRCRGFALIS